MNVCDMDGVEGEGVETVTFGLGRDEYEIELCARDAARLRERYAPFIEHARRATGGARKPRRTVGTRLRAADIRAWARQHGHPDIAERGRIPGDIVAKYDAAH